MQETRQIKKNISLPAESHHSTSRPAKRAGCSQRRDRRERRKGRGGLGKKARLEAQGVVLSCAAAAKKGRKDCRGASLVRGEVRVASDMPEWPWEKKQRESEREESGSERARESEGREPDVRLLASFQRSLLDRTILMSVSKDCRQFPFHPLFFLLFLPRRGSARSCCCQN